jgi:hypothetical protein
MNAPVVALLVTSVLALSACADNGETDRAMDRGEMPADMPQRDGTPGMGGMDMAGMHRAQRQASDARIPPAKNGRGQVDGSTHPLAGHFQPVSVPELDYISVGATTDISPKNQACV